ncbi:MAG TPA: 30S ribosomal protein S1 [Bacillota bacterium]
MSYLEDPEQADQASLETGEAESAAEPAGAGGTAAAEQPVEEARPEAAAEPAESAESAEPAGPAGPEEPTELAGTAEPGEPAGTAKPAEPAGSAEPGEPARGAGTAEPAADRPSGEELPVLEHVSPGDVVRGIVRRVEDDLIVVDVGYKADGVVPRSELTLAPGQNPRDLFEEGQALYVSVLSVDPRDGGLLLSERRARAKRAWTDLEQAMAERRILKAPVVEAVKGGLIVDVGLRAFMPASHVERGYVNDLNRYVGQTVRARVIEMDRAKSRVILSQKSVLDEEYQRRREETWNSLEAGQLRTGVVKGMTDFGAFIDLGGVDGLLHVSELAWGRVERPSDVLREGQEVTVKVLKVDRERERVSLSLKQTLPDPWEGAAARYPEGSWVKGRVARLAPFGAFVEFEPGIEGLVHISEMADRHVARPDEVVQEGDEVQVRVLRVQEAQRRISLSLKPEPQRRSEPPVERGEGEGSRRGGGRRRGRDRKRGAERERPRAEVMEREPEGITLGEMFGDLFQQTRELLVNEQRARGLSDGEEGTGDAEDPTPPSGAEAAAASAETVEDEAGDPGAGEDQEPRGGHSPDPDAAAGADEDAGEDEDETKPT